MEGIFLFPLGGDEDDTVRSPVSIYGTGCGIFEHGYVLYFGRVDRIHRARRAVHDNQRVGIVQCSRSADTETYALIARNT